MWDTSKCVVVDAQIDTADLFSLDERLMAQIRDVHRAVKRYCDIMDRELEKVLRYHGRGRQLHLFRHAKTTRARRKNGKRMARGMHIETDSSDIYHVWLVSDTFREEIHGKANENA